MSIINSMIHTKRSQELVGQIIPILVGWAKYGLTNKTYGDLIHALGYTRYSAIGDQLGNVKEKLFIKQLVDKSAPTPNGLGQYFPELVEEVSEKKTKFGSVAPHVGVWIETSACTTNLRTSVSLPMWEHLQMRCSVYLS